MKTPFQLPKTGGDFPVVLAARPLDC